MINTMKNLPISLQELSELVRTNCIYVDKTEHIYRMITKGKAYFLSRPRRFGKSLLISTLHEIFNGNKELFTGLWIYDKINWDKHPVIHLDFSDIYNINEPLGFSICQKLDKIANKNQLQLASNDEKSKMRELIEKLSVEKQVVILVDEYDKPIIHHISDLDKAEENRNILKNFYSILKSYDKSIRFLLITGVSKFSQVSIFSDLNHLDDISLSNHFSKMLGYTQAELEHYFGEYIEQVNQVYSEIYPDILLAIKEWYDGYSWDGVNFVYNPYDVLHLFNNVRFSDYWFQTATPEFLIKSLNQKQYSPFDYTEQWFDSSLFNKYEIDKIDIRTLLFQTGYLTIKKINLANNTVLLDYPNKEVAKSFSTHLLNGLNGNDITTSNCLLLQIVENLRNHELDLFIEHLQVLLAGVTYPLISKKENYYHSMFYLIIKLIGFEVEAEVLTHRGRIDAVVQTENFIYVIEFKMSDAQTAMQQIKEKQYHLKYMDSGKQITLLGIGFDVETKNVSGYEALRIENTL